MEKSQETAESQEASKPAEKNFSFKNTHTKGFQQPFKNIKQDLPKTVQPVQNVHRKHSSESQHSQKHEHDNNKFKSIANAAIALKSISKLVATKPTIPKEKLKQEVTETIETNVYELQPQMSLESETIEKNPSTEPMEIEYEKSERTDFKVQASGRINQMTQKPAMVYNYYRKNSEEIKERETPKDIDSVENRSMQPIFNGS